MLNGTIMHKMFHLANKGKKSRPATRRRALLRQPIKTQSNLNTNYLKDEISLILLYVSENSSKELLNEEELTKSKKIYYKFNPLNVQEEDLEKIQLKIRVNQQTRKFEKIN